jgi:hypothetical protein
MAIYLDPTQPPGSQGFSQIGTGPAQSNGTVLLVGDGSTQGKNLWARAEPALGSGKVTVRCTVSASVTQLANDGSSGVGLLLDGGLGKVAQVVLARPGGQEKIALVTPNGLSAGLPVGWASPVTFELAWDPTGPVTLSLPGGPSETLQQSELPVTQNLLSGPHWAFGCGSDAAMVTASFGVIEEVAAGVPASLNVDLREMEIKTGTDGKIECAAEVTLPASFSPTAASVALRVTSGGASLLDTGALQGFTPHPQHPNEWTTNAGSVEAKLRSLGNDRWKVEVEREHFNVPNGNYGSTTVEITIDGASGSKGVTLTQHGDKWEL